EGERCPPPSRLGPTESVLTAQPALRMVGSGASGDNCATRRLQGIQGGSMSEHTIPAPALRGDDPLGFLASVGITALSFVQAIPPVRLGWSDGFAPHAVFTSNAIDGVAGLAKELRGAADAITTAGAVLPGAPPDIPLVKTGTKGGDP